MRANKLLPTEVVGIENQGDLEERAVHTIRSGVAPTPSVKVASVDVRDGKACLIVQMPKGLEPPYVLLRTGQLLERTATSSDPVPVHNRASLDRLYAKGRRGIKWALTRADTIPTAFAENERSRLVCWTIPAVDGGLGQHSLIFRKSFFQATQSLLPRAIEGMWDQTTWNMNADSMTVMELDETYPCSLTVEVAGAVGTTWYGDKEFSVYSASG
jgi:hypothetical protein